MPDPLESLLRTVNLPAHNLPTTSRYYPIETAIIEDAEKQPIIYLRRRFIPLAKYYSGHQTHKVVEGDRLDNITSRYIGDPEQFWQVADANEAMIPEELTEENDRFLRIPQGFGMSEL